MDPQQKLNFEVLRHNEEVKGSEVAQLCPTLCDPMDRSPPGSSIHGIFQARVLEWVATDSRKTNIKNQRDQNKFKNNSFHLLRKQCFNADVAYAMSWKLMQVKL